MRCAATSSSSPRAESPRCRCRSRSGATSSACAPTSSASPGWSTSPSRRRNRSARRCWLRGDETLIPRASGARVHDGRMPLFAFEGREPQVSPGAWIAPTATLVGDVRVEAEASVWYGAVLRADFGPIVVRPGANIQDGSVLHGGDDPVTEIGAGATVGHLCVVHGAVIGTEALVGNGATVLDGVVVGPRALVAAGATVPPGMAIPGGMLAAGVPARILGEISGGAKIGRAHV